MMQTKIVITGGPCAGKSTALSRIKVCAEARGYTVLTVPEVATELIGGGVAPWTCASNAAYQECQMRLQNEKEKIFARAAQGMQAKSILIVCDRGLLDNKAYMTKTEFEEVLSLLDATEDAFLSEYDAVFHLVTAARGAEAFYTTENNASRTETPEEARVLDEKLIVAWEKHPHHFVIENGGSFEDKMARLLTALEVFLDGKDGAAQ